MSVDIIHDQMVPMVSFVVCLTVIILPLVMLVMNAKMDFSVIIVLSVQPETLVLIANMILTVP